METETKREMFNLKLNKLLETINDGQISLDDGVTKKTKRKLVGNSVYDKRYQTQKEIIACQKATISEQKQEIEKLKLQNASLESEVVFLKNLTEHLKRDAVRKEEVSEKIINASSGEKIIENVTRGSDILSRMQQREEERKKRWQQIKDQKANKERIEKMLLVQKEEEERMRAIEEKKRKEQEENDRKIEAEEKLKRFQARKQIVIFKLKAWQSNHFAYVGFWKWTLFIKLVHTKRNITTFRIRRFLAMRYFQRWLFNAVTIREARLLLARSHYLKTLQTKAVNKWKKVSSFP